MNQNSALLVMDMQNGIAGTLDDLNEIIGATNEAIAVARRNNIPIIFVRVAFSESFSEISPNNKIFSRLKNSGQSMTIEDEASQIINELNVESNDLIITKQRISAFTGSNLDVLLRGLQVNNLILTGVATSGVVLSTTVEAIDKDFKLTILKDATADRDIKTHEFLLDNILPKYGQVLSTKEWKEVIE